MLYKTVILTWIMKKKCTLPKHYDWLAGPQQLFFLCVMSGWLDDIGLPQYKDSFSEGSVDGHMLNYLTYVSNDILLEVVSC